VIRLVRAELLKLSTTRLLLWLGLLILALSALVVSTRAGSMSREDLAQLSEQRSIVQFAALGTLVAVIAGIVGTAGEYGHGTINYTFLVTPRRERVMAAKLVGAAIAGIGVTLFAEAVTYAIAAIWISAEPVPFQLTDGTIWTTYATTLAAAALGGALGAGLGAVLRRQTTGIMLSLIWLLVGEPVLAVAGVERYAPGHAMAALVAAGSGGGQLLDPWAGAVVTLAYVTVFALAGTLAVMRTDVT
jgi:ABC-type transport system involved in multi-copper enzyme maturation permease subunit